MKRFLVIPLFILALGAGVAAPLSMTHGVAFQQAHAQATGAGTGAGKAETQHQDTNTGIFTGIMQTIASMFAWLLGVAAYTLDYVVQYTVVQMGTVIGGVNGLSAIGVVWRILRDMANIILLFGFVAIGISVILDANLYGSPTKMLPMLLIAAVFLNFSLFVSEAVIDVGNLFATEFYAQINGGSLPNLSTLGVGNEGISNKVMAQMGLQNIYNAPETNSKIFSGNAPFWVAFLSTFLFLIATFVFFTLAFIFVARFVVLVFLIVASPIGFAGLAIPGLSKIAGQWWSQLLEQAFIAPVLLLMLYIALAVITDARFLTGFGATTSANWTAAAIPGGSWGGFASLLLSFFVAMGLLLAVTAIAKKMSAAGAGLAMKAGGIASFGLAAYGASSVIGGTGRVSRMTMQRVAPNHAATRFLSNNLFRPMENFKPDARRAGVGAAMGAMGIQEAAKPIGKSTVGRFDQGREGLKKMGEEANKQYDKETLKPRLRRAADNGDEAAVASLVGNMSDKQIEEIAEMVASKPIIAAALSQARFDKLVQSDAISNATKTAARKARKDGTDAKYEDVAHPDPRFGGRKKWDVALNGAPAGPHGEPAVKSMSSKQRAQLPDDVLTQPHVMAELQPSDFDQIQQRGEMEGVKAQDLGRYIQSIITPPPGAPPDPRAPALTALAAGRPNFKAFYRL